MVFWGSSISSKKRTNEFDFTTMIPQVDLCLFVFGKKSKTPKKNISKLTCIFVYFKINQNMSFMNYIQFWKHARMKLFLKIVIFVHILKSTLGFKDSIWWSCQKRIGPFQPMCIPYCTLSFAIDSCSGLLKFSFANSSMYTL